MTHYAVIGRMHGDDEDTCFVYECSHASDARQNFIDDMRALEDITPEDVEAGGEEMNVYITHVLKSAAPIEVA